MFDTRITSDTLATASSIYFMANCHQFVNSDSDKIAPFEKEIIDLLKEQGSQTVPFICVDKSKKIAARDIARNAYNNAAAAWKSNSPGTGRKQIQDGTNSILKLSLGEPLYEIITDAYSIALKIVKNPINNLSEEETMLLSAAGFGCRNKAINAGLVKP